MRPKKKKFTSIMKTKFLYSIMRRLLQVVLKTGLRGNVSPESEWKLVITM